MYELIQIGAHTYYIDCPVKMGVYTANDTDAYLIDSGNGKDVGKKVQKIFETKGWQLAGIINTHSHADHIGGNRLLQGRLGCPVFASETERAFVENPALEPFFLYGGYPCKELRNRFLMAEPSAPVFSIEETTLPAGLEIIPLPGHSFNMIGVKTSDDVYFLADCLTAEYVLNKYHVMFLLDLRAYLNTLEAVERLRGKLFIPAHAAVTDDVRQLVSANRGKVFEIIGKLVAVCNTPVCFEDILKYICDHYAIQLDLTEYVLVASTIRSYLSYLKDEGRLDAQLINNKLMWFCI